MHTWNFGAYPLSIQHEKVIDMVEKEENWSRLHNFRHKYSPVVLSLAYNSKGDKCGRKKPKIITIIHILFRDMKQWFWQRILSENLPSTNFLIFPLLLHFPLVTKQNKFYAKRSATIYPNFQQFLIN